MRLFDRVKRHSDSRQRRNKGQFFTCGSLFWKRTCGELHFGLFHQPIPILEAMKEDAKSQSCRQRRVQHVKRLLVWIEKKVKPKLVVVRRAMEGGETIHFEDDRPWSFFRTQNSHGTCKNTKGVQCSVWVVLRTSADTGPCSQSKVLQRHRWQRQKFLDTISSFLVHLERLVMLCFSIHSGQDGPRSEVLKLPRRMNVQMAEMHRDLMDVSEVNNVSRDVFIPKN